MKIVARPHPATNDGIPASVPEELRQHVIAIKTGEYECLQYDFGYVLNQRIPIGEHTLNTVFAVTNREVVLYAFKEHPFIGLLYAVKGTYSCRLIGSKDWITLRGGDYGPYYSPAGNSEIKLQPGVSGAVHFTLNTEYTPGDFAEFAPSLEPLFTALANGGLSGRDISVLRMNTQVRDSIYRMNLYQEESQHPGLYFKGILYNLIAELTKQLHIAAPQYKELKPREKLRQVYDMIVGAPNITSCSIENLAQMANMSVPNLRKLFKETYGESIQSFVRQQCLQKAAKMLLTDKDMRIEDIAFEVGYANQANLSNAFRDRYGIYPKEYRRKMQ